MKISLGKEGLSKGYQNYFDETTECCRCNGVAHIGFVAHEGKDTDDLDLEDTALYELHNNDGRGSLWLHDYCAVAVYFCKDCLETTALYNQG